MGREEKDSAVISSLGLSGGACQLDLDPPCTPHPAPFPLQPHARRQRWASHPTPPTHPPSQSASQPSIPRRWVEVTGQSYLQEGCTRPTPSPKSPALRPRRGAENQRRSTKHKGGPSVKSDGRGGRRSDRRVKGSSHTPPDRFLPSPPLPPPRSLRVCLFCLFKKFTEQEGRASSGGRTAARCRWCVGRRRTRRPPGR